MIKALSAIAVAACAAAALTVLPGFAPQVEASVPQPLAKADRLDFHPVGRYYSQQAWQNFEASCMRHVATRKLVPSHDALKSFALTGANDIDVLTRLKFSHRDLVTDVKLYRLFRAVFTDKS